MSSKIKKTQSKFKFDLSTEDGVLKALYAVRTSDIAVEDKNELRDSIFLYSRTHDNSIREQIEVKLGDLDLSEEYYSLESDLEKEEKKIVNRFGLKNLRRSPKFSVSTYNKTKQKDNDKVLNDNKSQKNKSDKNLNNEQTEQTEQKKHDLDSKLAKPKEDNSKQNKFKKKETFERTEPLVVEEYPATLERIREIKRFVSENVGTPVNLIDLNPDVGRVYMSTLLAAMQSVNSENGMAGTEQMQKLELALSDIKNLLHKNGSTNQVSNSANNTTGNPVQNTAGSSKQQTNLDKPEYDTPINSTESNSTPLGTNNLKKKIYEMKNRGQIPSVSDQIKNVNNVSPNSANYTTNNTPTQEVTQSPVTPVSNNVPTPDMNQGPVSPVSNNLPTNNTPTQEVTQSPVNNQNHISSPVASDKNGDINHKLTELENQSKANQYKGEPLFHPNVDSGLSQLLMEWSLFKSSGVFGTGPNGREHPLFIKLAPLMVNDILLGKFEGSKPEIIQSITDYMNGWRYEQGIVYQGGETFEHYLRRVIHTIISGDK